MVHGTELIPDGTRLHCQHQRQLWSPISYSGVAKYFFDQPRKIIKNPPFVSSSLFQ